MLKRATPARRVLERPSRPLRGASGRGRLGADAESGCFGMKLLRLAPENTKISFMRFRRISYPLSAVLSIFAVVLFLGVGMNFGIDFAGGTQVELRAHSGKADLAGLRGKANTLALGPVEAQRIGAESD